MAPRNGLSARVLSVASSFARACSAPPVSVVAFSAFVLLSPAVQAQVANVQPYFAAVTTDKTPLRCFHTETSYPVAELSAGMVVRVDGEGTAWARVTYPAKGTAFVLAEDARVDGAVLRTTNATKLRAANMVAGFDGSWKGLLETPLPVGTSLTLIDTVSKDGKVLGYRVAAPEGARGFVSLSSLRKATDAEIAASSQQPVSTPPTPAPAPVQPTPAPQPTTLSPESSTPTAQAPPVPANAENRKVGSLDELESTFQRIRSQPVLTAEIDELKAEFERALERLPSDSIRKREQLRQRVDYLTLRQDYREAVRKAEQAKASLGAGEDKLSAELAALEKTRVYTMIGVLTPSTVYDGTRLPLMYRVQSVGGVAPRTLGYLKPNKDLDLNRKLGKVVGVIGTAELDRSLKLNIITAARVDVLKAGEQAPAGGSETGTTPDTQPIPDQQK